MTPQTKKILLIGGSLLLLAGGIAYYSYRKTKVGNVEEDSNKEMNPEGSSDIPNESISSSNVKPFNTSKTPLISFKEEPKKDAVIVKLDDVLASSLTEANSKNIYPIVDGLKFYNLEGKEAGKTVKNKLLGKVAAVTKDSKGTKMVYFLGTNGVKYKMPSVGLNVAI